MVLTEIPNTSAVNRTIYKSPVTKDSKKMPLEG